MKNTMKYLIVSTKTLNATLILALFALAFSSCQSDEVAPFDSASPPHVPTDPDDVAKNPYNPIISPGKIIRTVYPGATQWWVRYKDPISWRKQYMQVYFSTVDGSFMNLAELNRSRQASAKVDLDILFGYLAAPTNSYDEPEQSRKFKYPSYLRNTQIKPSDLSIWDLAVMTYNPSQFQSAFENSLYQATNVQPYDYNTGDRGQKYQEGDVFLFKTDQVPVRYGAVRILTTPASDPIKNMPYILEITVQADNSTVELDQ